MDRKTLSISQAAAIAGVSRRTIYNWMIAAKIEFVRNAGGNVRIFEDSLWRDAEKQPLKSIEIMRDVQTIGDR